MDETALLLAAGVYLPPFAAGTGRRTVRVCNGDEDATTLAIEAGQDLLARYPAARIDQLHLAVARPDLVGGPQGEVVREALGLDPAVPVETSAGDALAGLSALRSAADSVAAGRAGSVLVIASEPGDGARISAGAIAVLVGQGGKATTEQGDGAVRITAFRGRGDVVYGSWTDAAGQRHDGDLRYLELTVAALAREAVDGAVPVVVTGVAAPAVARACGADAASALPDHGVAGPLLALCSSGGGTIVAATASRACAVETSAAPPLLARPTPPGTGVGPPTEVRSSPPLSLPGSSPFFQRASRELLRLEGARCRGCGHVVFPPSQRPICPECHGADFEPAPMARAGVVHTFVLNRFLPTGFGAEMTLVLGDLEDGNRYWAPTSGIRGGEIAIGAPVELRLRRFTDHGGAPTYAMKFVARRPVARSTVARSTVARSPEVSS